MRLQARPGRSVKESAYFAMIAAWTGEKDLAIEQLNAVVRPGVNAPFCTRYGMLKTFPFWDPLRGDPRFEKIVPRSRQNKPPLAGAAVFCYKRATHFVDTLPRRVLKNLPELNAGKIRMTIF